MKIKAIYDNGGKTFDRFTVYYNLPETNSLWAGRGMSSNPFHPLGFGQWISGCLGKHNGKKIKFKDLPKDCQNLVKSDLKKCI
tara:strand:- start:740 stop:988 length:249 start_codon:yes stop_codon:yes gene_type:complete